MASLYAQNRIIPAASVPPKAGMAGTAFDSATRGNYGPRRVPLARPPEVVSESRMKFNLAPTMACVCLVATLAACGQTPDKQAQAPAQQPGQSVISAAASQALARAEADVAEARGKFALWTSTENAFAKAREAARAGDSAEVLRQAGIASELARLGMEQLNYPSTAPR